MTVARHLMYKPVALQDKGVTGLRLILMVEAVVALSDRSHSVYELRTYKFQRK